MIKAVLFDLDCTLYDRDEAYVNLLDTFKRYFADRLTKELDDDTLLRLLCRCDRVGSYLNRGWAGILEKQIEAGLWTDAPTADELLDFIHAHFADAVRPWPDAAPLMETLKKQGYKLGLVTNGPEDFQTEKAKRIGLFDCFDCVLTSGAEGRAKPHPQIFAHALQLLGCDPEEAVFVGDSPVADVCGARGVGMHAVWMRYYDLWPEPYAKPAYSIARLAELPAVLSEIERKSK